jgi:hypothetical protein
LTPNLAEIGLAAGGAVASGLRLYGTVAALGLLHRLGALRLPPHLEVLSSTPILVIAGALFVVEFLADKIPVVDTVWDALHTFIRIPAAAVLGFAALSEVAEPWRMGAALLCGTIALSAHGVKAGARLVANTSPEPFTNWAASFVEDFFVAGVVWAIVSHPAVAIGIGLAFLAAGIVLARWAARGVRRLFARRPNGAGVAVCLFAVALLTALLAFRIAGQIETLRRPAVAATESGGGAAAAADPFGGLADAVEGGEMNVEVDIRAGRVVLQPDWSLEVTGAPSLVIHSVATGGKVDSIDANVVHGELVVAGRGWRPKIRVDSMRVERGRGIVDARFQGLGIWGPIVRLSRLVALNALRHVRFKMDIPSMMRGDVMESAPVGVSPGNPTGASFLELLREARVRRSFLRAFPGRRMAFANRVSFRTAPASAKWRPVTLTIEGAMFRPQQPHGGAPASFEIVGGIAGDVEQGSLSFPGSRTEFSHGRLEGGRFTFRSTPAGIERTVGAALLSLELASGQFRVPGGPGIAIERPSRISLRDFSMRSDGAYSGRLGLALTGQIASIQRAGTRITANRVTLRAPGLFISDGKATGDVELELDYELGQLMSLTSASAPGVSENSTREPLSFRGPFAARLHLQGAGAGTGRVTGDYQFRVPWEPVERLALASLRAHWVHDAPVVSRVFLAVEPRRLSPCGESCFQLDLEVNAEMNHRGMSLFRQNCRPRGTADLVVDAPTRTFQLENIRIDTRCEGFVGRVVNMFSPLLTKNFRDMVLFQMPGDLPFTVEKVRSVAGWLAIAGRLDYDVRSRASEKSGEKSSKTSGKKS